MRCKLAFLILAIAVTFPSFAALASNNIIGKWQSSDSATQEPSSIVTIKEVNNAYVGTITKIFAENNHKVSDVCVKCKGDLRNKPIMGMNILHAQIEPSGAIKSCAILDPQQGAVYHCTLDLVNGGKTIKLHGYIGMPLIGRTEYWQRFNDNA
jgi:uncharacterized protein (DUF2147 family)